MKALILTLSFGSLFLTNSGKNIGKKAENLFVGECAVTCVHNQLDCPINYLYRWGEDEWKASCLAANTCDIHSYTYQGCNYSSPALQIRFDYDLSSGEYYKEYCLERYRSYSADCTPAKKYVFQKCPGSTSLIDIYSCPDSGASCL